MQIFVIAGHGAGDSGAVGNGYTEAERVRALATRIKQYGGNNVILGDMNRNYYRDNGVSYLSLSKSVQIVELHMDSGAAGARGGHVIINGRYNADSYDIALANFISGVFPGRSNNLVKRTDLANSNRAAAKGYSYRLIECGFISNANDVSVFNSKLDTIAKGILSCFGIGAASNVAPVATPAPATPTPATPTPVSNKSASGINVQYQAYAKGKGWLAEIKNYNNSNSNGYAGWTGYPIMGLRAKTLGTPSAAGYLEYRVHAKGGGWYGWRRDYNKDSAGDTFAGTCKTELDAVQFRIAGVAGRHVKYRVHTSAHGWLGWVTDYNNNDCNGYAGWLGCSFDAIQIEII